MFNKLHKVAVSVAASGALVLALNGSGVAWATSTDDDLGYVPNTPTSDAIPGTAVDINKPGVIHVVKYDDGEGAKPANGAKDQGMPGKGHPIEGIEFTLTPVAMAPGIGLMSDAIRSNDNDVLKKLARLRASDVEAACLASDPDWGCTDDWNATGITNSKGEITFDAVKGHPLRAGVYLLSETDSVAADGKTYKKAPASLIFLPMTNPSGDGWLTSDDGSKYEVWVYPKNSLEDNIKSVVDKEVMVGGQVTYQITASVPAVYPLSDDEKAVLDNNGRGYDLNGFGLWDNLDSKLQLTSADSVSVMFGTDAENATSLTANDDYFVKLYEGAAPANSRTTVGTDATGSTATGQKLVVVLTVDGLQKVATAKSGDTNTKVFFTFAPTVKESGVIPNKAQLYKNYGKTKGITEVDNPVVPFDTPDVDSTFVTNTVVSAWGKLAITKTDEKDQPLEHAKFKVYGKKKNEAAFNYAAGQELTVNGVSEFETNEHGVVTIDGLHATNLENSGADVNGYEKYALVEVKAPAGYELDRGPREFTIDVATSMDKVIADDSWQIDDDGVVTASDLVVAAEVTGFADDTQTADIADAGAWLNRKVTVVNIPVKPRLPLTGGAGIAIFGLLGGGLLLGGLYAAKRNSRQAK